MDRAKFLKLKENHKGYIILQNDGLYYQTWYEDAKCVSSVLGLALVGEDGKVRCGFSCAELDKCLHKLIENNYKIAII